MATRKVYLCDPMVEIPITTSSRHRKLVRVTENSSSEESDMSVSSGPELVFEPSDSESAEPSDQSDSESESESSGK